MDGNLVIDNWTRQRRGEYFFGQGTLEERGVYELKANTKHDILVEWCNVRSPADGDEDEALMDRFALTLLCHMYIIAHADFFSVTLVCVWVVHPLRTTTS